MKGMRSLLLVLAVAFSGLPLLAEAPMTNLRIEVKNLSDKPVERAAVVVDFISGRSVAKFGKKIRTHWELRTTQEGVVRIPPIPQGKIKVLIIATGFQTYGQVYDVNEEEKTIEIKLNPPQAQYSAHQ